MQRQCCVCYQPKRQLLRCGQPLVVDVCKSGDAEALENILKHNPDIAHSDLHLICHAADNGSCDCVRLLLDNGVNINVKNNGNMALHLAAHKGYTAIVRKLLEIDRSLVKARADDGSMPLHLAAGKGHTETVRLLLDIDSSLAKEEDGDGHIALHLAALGGHTETARALLEIDRSLVEVGDYYGNTALHLAARKGHTKTVEALLYYGPLANSTDDNGITALDLAVLYGKTETVEVLLKFDPSLANDENNLGRRATPLHFAAEGGYEECLALLIRANANIHAIDEKGNTPLYYATMHGHIGCMKLLLQSAAQMHIKAIGCGGSTPLNFANRYPDDDSIKELSCLFTARVKIDDTDEDDKATPDDSVSGNGSDSVNRSDSVNSADSVNCSDSFNGSNSVNGTDFANSIDLANSTDSVNSTDSENGYDSGSSKTSIDSRKRVLNGGPDTDPAPRKLAKIEPSTIREDRDALDCYAAENDGIKCLRYLLSRKVNIKHVDESGKTALHYAAEKGHLLCLVHLIFNGADINHADKSGKTALHYAVFNKDERCLEHLCKKYQHITPNNANRALRLAIDENYQNKSTDLLVDRIRLDDQDETDGKTLLHYAAEKGGSYLAKLLLKDNSAKCINIEDIKGRTPLHCAAVAGQGSCIQTLLYEVHEEVKQLLVKKKVKKIMKLRQEVICINAKDNNGDTALLLAAQHNHKSCVKELIKAQADVQEKNESGMTLLHFIARSEHKIDWLDIQHYKYAKEDVTKPDLNGNTPLHYAAYHGNKVFLTKICTDFNKVIDFKTTTNDKGATPLHLAIQGDNDDCLIKLLEFIKTDDERLSELFLYAAGHGKINCLRRLKEDYRARVDINHRSQNNMTPLHYVVKDDCWVNNSPANQSQVEGYRHCLQYLLDGKAKINIGNNEGKTPLHLAAEASNIECLVTLLDETDNRVNIHATDKWGNKPLALAKHPDSINALKDATEKVNNPPNQPLYYRNNYFKEPGNYFKEPGNQGNCENEQVHNQGNTVNSASPVRYQEKLLTSNHAVNLISYQEKYPECNFIPITEDNSVFVLARDFFDIITGNYEDTIFGYSGIRGNPDNKNYEELKKIYVPVQFVNNSNMNYLPLDGYPFHIEGTKNRIMEFLHKYAARGFHFRAKSIDPNEPDTKVSVNINLCLENPDLISIVRDFFTAPIKYTIAQISLDHIGKFIEYPEFQRLLNKICDVFNTDDLKEKLQKEVVKIVKEHQKNLGGKPVEQTAKITFDGFDGIINTIRKQLKMRSMTEINEVLLKNNFSHCSGPVNLLHNIKRDQKIQIEFDRFESSNRPARLQINSTGSQAYFKDLLEVLKVLFKMDYQESGGQDLFELND